LRAIRQRHGGDEQWLEDPTDKVCVVTGGAGGIGRDVGRLDDVERLADEAFRLLAPDFALVIGGVPGTG
jgi:hypothetical protein